MPRLSEEKINEIRQSVDIVDVISAYLPLVKKGRNYLAVCPFHDDSNPSMSISPEKQIFMCFVCHHGGNVFTFLKDYLKISYIEAVKKVAEIGRIDLTSYNLSETKAPINEKLEPMFKMHEEASKIYTHYLNTKLGLEAKEYLNNRKINDEIIETFQIGYAINKPILVKPFEKMGYSLIDMYKSGLVIESTNNYDRFTDRIMFPLNNQEGRVIGFSGRIFKQNQSNDSKYMNSPESDIFIKGDTLYNYHRVKEEVRKKGYIIITEGFMDVIAFYKVGIKNVVAIMGTAFTSGHLKALRKLTTMIYLCLDGDQAGKAANLKSCNLLEENGFKVKIVNLPTNKDPDEVLETSGKDELIALVDKAVLPIEFKIAYYYEKTNMENYDDRKEYLENIAGLIGDVQDEIDQEYYINELEKRSGFSKSIILKLVNQKKSQYVKPVDVSITYQKTVHLVDKYERAERDLLYYMMSDKSIALQYETKAGFMFNDIYRIIASYIVDFYRQNIVLEVADLINGIENENIVKNIISISELSLPKLKDNQAIEDYIRIIKEKAKKSKIEELTKSLAETLDPKQQAKILKEIIETKEKD